MLFFSIRCKAEHGRTERYLFHGVPNVDNAHGIVVSNFDPKLAGKENGSVYGKGVYFATRAFDSHNCAVNTDIQYFIFITRVVIGKFMKGEEHYDELQDQRAIKAV